MLDYGCNQASMGILEQERGRTQVRELAPSQEGERGKTEGLEKSFWKSRGKAVPQYWERGTWTQQRCVQSVTVPGITRTPPMTHAAAPSLHLSLYKMSKIKIRRISQGGKPCFPCLEMSVASRDQPTLCEVVSGPRLGGLRAVIPPPERINQNVDLTQLNFSQQWHVQAGIF